MGDILSAFVVYGATVLAFAACVSAISRGVRPPGCGADRDSGHGSRPFPIWSLLALGVPLVGLLGDPLSGMLAIGPLTPPSTPWVALLGSSLADLGWLLAGAAVGVGHFNILGLHSRLSTFAAALAFLGIGTVLANADALAK